MNELVVIVEGDTEQTFVRDQLAAHLALHGTNAWPVLPGRRRNRGGVIVKFTRKNLSHLPRKVAGVGPVVAVF